MGGLRTLPWTCQPKWMDRCKPPSAFLKSLIGDAGPLLGSEAEANIRQLIEMASDEHAANRAWATFLLAQHTGARSVALRDGETR